MKKSGGIGANITLILNLDPCPRTHTHIPAVDLQFPNMQETCQIWDQDNRTANKSTGGCAGFSAICESATRSRVTWGLPIS